MNLKNLPQYLEGTTLRGERNGVKWYSRTEDHNVLHIMILPDQFLVGGWVSGKFVFNQLATLDDVQRAAFIRRLLA